MSSQTTTPVCAPHAGPYSAGVKWQRCQFHLAQNAIHHSPNLAIRKRIGAELRTVWNAPTLKAAEIALADLVKAYQPTVPKLADWLEKNMPEG
jgi:transposase-like protein